MDLLYFCDRILLILIIIVGIIITIIHEHSPWELQSTSHRDQAPMPGSGTVASLAVTLPILDS